MKAEMKVERMGRWLVEKSEERWEAQTVAK
jgi:hypothetical protein